MDQSRYVADDAPRSGERRGASRRALIEHELSQDRWWSFAEPLETAYVETAGRWRKDEDFSIRLAMVLHNLWVVVDYVSCPDVWQVAFAFRLLVVTPLFAFVARFDRRRPQLRGVPTLLIVAALWLPMTLIYLHSSHPTVAFSYLVFPLSLIFVNLSLSASLRYTIVANIFITMVFTAAIRFGETVPFEFEIPLFVVMVDVVVLTLATKVRLEHARRRAWLLLERDRLRVEDWKDRAASLSVASATDALTGAANRRAFDAEVTRLCADPLGGALVLFDLDHFKPYNDAYGHQAGDACLRQIVEIARRRLRSQHDRVARYGGEEFALLLPGCSLADGKLIAEHLRVAVAAAGIRHPTNPAGIVTASFGVAAVAAETVGADALVAAADQALYAAKAAGRNRVHPPVAILGDDGVADDIAWADQTDDDHRGAA